MTESLQHKLDRVRPPRVQITYDVEIGNAIVMKELPFVMGILADLSGMPEENMASFRERKFTEIDRDSFNEIMEKIRPRLALRVANKIDPKAKFMDTELFFHSIDDFSPLNVIGQIEPLNALYQARSKLKDLLAKIDGNDMLDGLLQQLIQNPDQLKALQSELGKKSDKPSKSDKPAG